MSTQIPESVQQLASALGVDVNEMVERLRGMTPGASVAATDHVIHQEVQDTQVTDGVTQGPAETNEQKLERELAVSRQETQQVRKFAQTLSEGRVIGSGGAGSAHAPIESPNLGGIEPGIRFLVRNGVIGLEELEKKVAPVIVDLFKNDLGGVI